MCVTGYTVTVAYEILNTCNYLNACCAHEGETGTTVNRGELKKDLPQLDWVQTHVSSFHWTTVVHGATGLWPSCYFLPPSHTPTLTYPYI